MIDILKNEFSQWFDSKSPVVFKSPGRINLIGEHTDYNGGFVLPASIDKAIYFAIAFNDDNVFRFVSYDLNDEYVTPIDKIEPCDKQWANYLLGIIAQFIGDGKKVKGFDCIFGGDIPIGAGMSSSAALDCGLAFALNDMQSFGYSKPDLAKFAQKAEHEYVGIMSGIMDQFVVLHGKKDKVIKLDTRSLEYELFSVDLSNHIFILVNTGVKHSLASSEYNKRRYECEKGVEILQKYNQNIKSLRDVNLNFIQQHKMDLSNVIYNRCSYVIEENMRLERAYDALINGDFTEFGNQMYGSHEGLKEKYEVSCDELDLLVDIAKNTKGVIGARMMGGGFGGCTINLVEKNAVSIFKNSILAQYKTPEGEEPQIIEAAIENGTQKIGT